MTDEAKAKNGAGSWNPYLAGVALGMTLLASFLILGAGLGASGGLSRLSAEVCSWVAPGHTRSSEYFGSWGDRPMRYYLVFMLAGVIAGGAISALLGGRMKVVLERGAAYPWKKRAALVVAGGLLVGFASRLAQGCTSGQALSGGAQLLTGSLVFLCCVFAGGYAVAYFVRRQWHD